jgi:hypothetical protein
VSVCVGKGPSALFFPGAYYTVKTALHLVAIFNLCLELVDQFRNVNLQMDVMSFLIGWHMAFIKMSFC